ncbi:MAG TPA: (d)CMP kinase [Actinomycetota bacterium]|nr:(d)CMP kinase [Actinomycetota bacterium]
MTRPIVIAIDGPAGAGKSSVSSGVARRLGIARLDTGSMYRAVTWAALRDGTNLDDETALASLARRLDLSFDVSGILIDGRPRETEIRDPAVTASVSKVSRHPAVRAALVSRQQKLAEQGPAVVEGRDIGTVVVPWAPVKIFLTASARERARRRAKDLEAAGHEVDLDRLQAEIEARDAADDKTTPLVPAGDAVAIDSTAKTIDEVVDEIAALAAAAGLGVR